MPVNDVENLKLVIAALQDHIQPYLTQQGIDINRRFRCPNPDHNDSHPSAGLIPNSNRGYCHACKASFDIFDLAVWLEGKPASGPGWLTETCKGLADKFNIDFETPQLSNEEMYELEVRNAYFHAYQIIRHFKSDQLSVPVQKKLAEMQWPQNLRYRMGIGGVLSFDDFLHRMTVQYGHSTKLLKDCDLLGNNAQRLFSSQNLIYTIRDEHGSPVGFSARNLLFEEEKAAGDSDSKKYIHTREDGTLFHKKTTLYNLDMAKRHTGPIYVFEGQPDVVSMAAGGAACAVGTLGTSFTREHLDILMELGFRHIVTGLDNDKAGKEATKRVINLVQECGAVVGLRLEVVTIPEGVKDPDEYIRKFATFEEGVTAYRQLERTDIFAWSIKDQLEHGEDPFTVCETTIPLILNETSNVVRMRKVEQLARLTNTSQELIQKEVLRLIDQDQARIEEERNLIRDDLVKNLRQSPGSLASHLTASLSRLETLEKRKAGYSPQVLLTNIDELFDQKEKNVDKYELRTGYPLYDDLFNGIPRAGGLFSLPGKPHHGKSVWVDNVILGLLENNADLIVVLHTVDDSTNDRINRLLGARTGLPSDCFRRPGFYLHHSEGQRLAQPGFAGVYQRERDWYRRMHEEERLIVADSSVLKADLRTLKVWIDQIRQKFADKAVVVVGDNFHLYSMETKETGAEKIREHSRFISDEIVNELKVTGMFTMEIPSSIFKPGMIPLYTDLKGSGGLAFDSKANCTVYNQLQDFQTHPDKVGLWWNSSQYQEHQVNHDGTEVMVPIRKPVIQVITDKNKISGKNKTLFYELENLSGKMREAPLPMQQEYALRFAHSVETQDKLRKEEAAVSRAQHRSKL